MQLNKELNIWVKNVHVFGRTEMALHSWTLVLLKLGDSVTEESDDQLLTSETHAYNHQERKSIDFYLFWSLNKTLNFNFTNEPKLMTYNGIKDKKMQIIKVPPNEARLSL